MYIEAESITKDKITSNEQRHKKTGKKIQVLKIM